MTGVKAPLLRTCFTKEGDALASPWQKRGSIWGKLIFHRTTWKRNRNEPSSGFSLIYTFSVDHVYPSNASPHPQGSRRVSECSPSISPKTRQTRTRE